MAPFLFVFCAKPMTSSKTIMSLLKSATCPSSVDTIFREPRAVEQSYHLDLPSSFYLRFTPFPPLENGTYIGYGLEELEVSAECQLDYYIGGYIYSFPLSLSACRWSKRFSCRFLLGLDALTARVLRVALGDHDPTGSTVF